MWVFFNANCTTQHNSHFQIKQEMTVVLDEVNHIVIFSHPAKGGKMDGEQGTLWVWHIQSTLSLFCRILTVDNA